MLVTLTVFAWVQRDSGFEDSRTVSVFFPFLPAGGRLSPGEGGCFVGWLVSFVNEASVLRGPLSDLRAVDFCVWKQ